MNNLVHNALPKLKHFHFLFFVILMMSFAQTAKAQPTVLGTSCAGGSYITYNLNTVGDFLQYRILATSSASSGSRVWEFATGTAASTNYSTNWRPYTSGNTLLLNTYIPTSYSDGALYNTGSGGSSGLLPAIVSGDYYTFNVSHNAAANNIMELQQTSYNPVTITSVSQSPSASAVKSSNSVTVTVTTSAAPSSGEYVFVRYTTNGYSSSTIAQVTFSGSTGTATIPAQSQAANVSYYIFSSSKSASSLASDYSSYGETVYDMGTLNLNNNSGNNYSYTVLTNTTTTASSPAAITYGATSVTLSASVSPSAATGTVNFYIDGSPTAVGSGTLSGGTATYNYNPSALSATAHTISATYLGNTVYAGSSTTTNGTLTINTAALTVTANAQSKNYGSMVSTTGVLNTTFTVTGLKNSDAVNGATLAYSGSPAGNLATAPVNTYTIMPSAAIFSAGSASNYTITYTNGTLTVNQLPLNFTGSRMFNGTAIFNASDLAVSNAVNGDVVTLSGSATVSGSATGNYTSFITNGLSSSNSNYSVTGGTVNVSITSCSSDTWTGATSSDWNDGTNWSCSIPPSSSADVVIPSSSNTVLSSDVTIHSISIGSTSTVSINGHSFTINGTVAGSGSLSGSTSSKLTIGGSAGTISFTNDLQVLDSLTIESSGSGTLGTPLKIASTGGVKINNGGTFATSGELTLQSDANGTAQMGAGASTGGYISGNVIVERYIPADNNRAWRLLSVPTNSPTQTINAAWQEGQTDQTNTIPGYGTIITAGVSNTSWRTEGFDTIQQYGSIQNYSQGTNTWNYLTSTLTPIATTSGYFLYIRGDRSQGPSGNTIPTTATTLRTAGPLYQGDQSAINIPTGKFGLIGNVYASAIDFTGLTIGGGTANTFYVWDPKIKSGSSLGVYQTFSSSTGWSTPIMGGSYGATNTRIEPGSAFFVYAPNSTGTIQLKESSKVGSSNDVYRPEGITANAQLRANLYAVSANGPITQQDGNFEVFGNSYVDEIDANDAIKFANTGENFGILRNDKTLAIETRQPVTVTDTIFYNMWNMLQSKYQLELSASNFGGVTAYLEDKYLGTSTELNMLGSTKISFSINSDLASAAAGRFVVVFRPAVSTPTIVQTTTPVISVMPNPVIHGNLNLKFTNEAPGKYSIRLINITGQSIFEAIINYSGGSSLQTIQLPSTAEGVYKLQIINPAKQNSNQKVILMN